MTAGERLRPRFFIIGERKCGTSSLYRYLVAHPHVLPGRLKEPNFFGRHPEEEIAGRLADYFALFPKKEEAGDATLLWPELDEHGVLSEEPIRFQREAGRAYITGEASANTFYDVSPELLRRHLPDLELILVLRDPVQRAFSHHRMLRRFQAEGPNLGFEVGEFADDMRAEIAAAGRGESPPCLAPGIYAERLERWVKVWGRRRLHVYLSEDLDDRGRCRRVMDELQRHLGLPHHDYGDYLDRRFNRAPPAQIPAAIRTELRAFYAPCNRALERALGRPIEWR